VHRRLATLTAAATDAAFALRTLVRQLPLALRIC